VVVLVLALSRNIPASLRVDCISVNRLHSVNISFDDKYIYLVTAYNQEHVETRSLYPYYVAVLLE
jgi:hypothetical protein